MPKSVAGQMMAVLIVSFALLLGILAMLEYFEYDTVTDTVDDPMTVQRFRRILPVMNSLDTMAAESYLARVSHCHDGYTLSAQPYSNTPTTALTQQLASTLASKLSLAQDNVRIVHAVFEREDFGYSRCMPNEIPFPIEGLVVSARLDSGQWLNAEIHPHEWHLTPSLLDWLIRSATAFVFVGIVAFIFIRRLCTPFKTLAASASAFAAGLEPKTLDEAGPLEVQRTIHAFNVMQRQVVDGMKRRSATLAAISHDLRSPLTALRLKAEMIEDAALRADHIASIDKMERVTASALAYLKGEARHEKKRVVDLAALVASECTDFQEAGHSVTFLHPARIEYRCRADALARAVRNLIENAVKYGEGTEISIDDAGDTIDILVVDRGPGIPRDQVGRALQPFEQLSAALDDPGGGFGLGLAIAKALVEGHDGQLVLRANRPHGLIAVIRLPKRVD